MNGYRKMFCVVIAAACAVLAFEAADAFGRGGGGGGARGGGGGRVGGGGGGFSGGGARPSGPVGGGISRPSGSVGGGVSRPSAPVGGGGFNPGVNRSPAVSAPKVNAPSVGARPGIQPGGGLGAHDRPGVVSPPSLTPGNRPSIGPGQPGIAGKGPVGPGIGARPPIATAPGVGKGVGPGVGVPGVGVRPGVGAPGLGRGPSVLPGLAAGGGLAAAGKAGDYLGRRQDNVGDRQQNIADRSQNLQGRLDQRQDFRNQSQDKRQDYMNDRREDWQNWRDDYYGHHDNWYHGAWCDHAGDYWSHMWSDHTAAMVLGTTMWGLNRMGYWFGTSSYENPYYTEPLVVDGTTISYAEPLAAPPAQAAAPAAPDQPAALPPGATPEGMKQFDAARAAFYSGDYPTALTAANKAVASMPTDALIHEFRALVLFALGKYRDAAATLNPVLAVGPGWDWTTMSSLYPDSDTYAKQLRALEDYVTANPKSYDARFVLAYHYLTCGHNEQAAEQLAIVQKAVPNDAVTAQILQMMGKGPPAPPALESKLKIDPASVVGVWSATSGKASFEMTLGNDKSFTWTYSEGTKKEQVKGAFAVDGNVLALEPDAGGVMLAEITAPTNGAFDFRTVGAPPSDKGLRFTKK